MAFVVGVIGVVVLHENYSRYNEHSNHYKYGDAEMRSKISNLQNQVNRQKADADRFWEQMKYDYESRIDQLKREHGYSALYNSGRSNLVDALRAEMRKELESSVSRDKRELDESIQRERAELDQINKMINRINSIELNVKKKI